MTETEWHADTGLWPLLVHVEDKSSERKLRLLAVACCYRIWDLIPAEAARECVVAAEQYADGQIAMVQLEDAIELSMKAIETEWRNRTVSGKHWGAADRAARDAVSRVHRSGPEGRNGVYWNIQSAWALNRLLSDGIKVITFGEDSVDRESLDRLREEEQTHQIALLREIFGNPFRPVTIDPAWITSTVDAIAKGIYSDKAFDRLPILADALEDADCDNNDILNHLRCDSTHVRGCWALDLVLGKQ